MGVRTSVRGICIGMVLALGLGTVDAQAQGASPAAAPTAADSGAKAGSGAPAAKVEKKKRELTAEQKTFEQSIKAMRVQSDQMNRKFVKAARKREKARREGDKAGRTPSTGMSPGSGNGGATQTDFVGNGKGGKG